MERLIHALTSYVSSMLARHGNTLIGFSQLFTSTPSGQSILDAVSGLWESIL